MYIDYLYRKNVNSLKKFMYKIEEREDFFTNRKMLIGETAEVAIPLKEFTV